jgi:hypothetical protein
MIYGERGDAFFRNFGSPVYVEDGTMFGSGDIYFPSSGGGGSGFWNELVGSVGDAFSGFSFSPNANVKVALTRITDQAEAALKSNLAAWQAGQVSADAALERGWSILNSWVAQCYRYGQQGVKSVEERDRRLQSPNLRWDWIGYYLDPISMAAKGAPASAAPVLPSSGAGGWSGAGFAPVDTREGSQQLLIIAGLFVIAWLLLKDKQ